MPKISAVMALYNTPKDLLKITTDSILNQSFADFELLIIDDCSTEDYSDFFPSYKDERIKYFKLSQNAGPGHARNEGIKKAVGEYVAIVDSDDVYFKDRFKIQSEFLDANQDISLLSGTFKQSNNGKVPFVVQGDNQIKAFMLFNSPLANPLVMIRREDFVSRDLFYPKNINFGEDYLLWISAMFAGLKMENLDEVLMIYTRRKGQLSRAKQEQQETILKEIYQKAFDKLGMDYNQNEVDLHFNIATECYHKLNEDDVSEWFDKIIQANGTMNLIKDDALIVKKKEILATLKNSKNRVFKIKIGQKNFCIYKPLKFTLEKRN